MEEVLASPVLQLGALGGMIVFMVVWIRQQGRETENDQQVRAKRDEFIEGLVTKAFESQTAHMTAWRDLTTETIQVYQKVGAAYEEMNQALEANCDAILNGTKQSHMEHLQMDTNVIDMQRGLDELAKTMSAGHGEIKGVLSEQRH